MLKKNETGIIEVLANLPAEWKVLDVGGASGPLSRANQVIDIVPFDQVHFDNLRGPKPARFNKDSYTQFDICSREKWPFVDKFFDYSVCSHVLEDIRDPLWVCSELIRTSKAGYIEVPSHLYELTFGLEARGLAGASHHRWLIDLYENKLRFTFKYFYIHSPAVNRQQKDGSKGPEAVLGVEWNDDFDYFENWLNSGKEIFEFYLNRKISEKEKWQLFRKVQNRNIFVRWAKYFKNTRPWVRKFFVKK